MKKHLLTATAVAFLIAASALPATAQNPNECTLVICDIAASARPATAQNVAVVNGKPIPKARLTLMEEQVAEDAAHAGRPPAPGMQAQLKNEVISREILMQEAQKQQIDKSVDFLERLEKARQGLMIRQLFLDYFEKHSLKGAEVKAKYESISAGLQNLKEYEVRHILTATEDEAKTIIAQLKKGGNFEEIAKKQSLDSASGANGGDLGWTNLENYEGKFAHAVSKLKKGQTTDAPVSTRFGFHIIRVADVRTPGIPTFEEFKLDLAQKIPQEKLAEYQQEVIARAPPPGIRRGPFVSHHALLESIQETETPADYRPTAQFAREREVAVLIFMQEAQKQGTEQSAAFLRKMELTRQSLLIKQLFSDYREKHPVTDAQVKAEYERLAREQTPVTDEKNYRVRHILVEKEDEAKAIIGQLKKGGKFDEIAKIQSKDPESGANGGDLGWAPSSAFPTELAGALKKLNKGQATAAPVKSVYGYHIIRVDDVREGRALEFEDAKTQLVQQMQQQRLERYRRELRTKAKIE